MNGRINSGRNSIFRNLSKALVLICAIGFLAAASQVFAQGAKDTENATDKNLRSAARINPSTLAMELSIPLGAYPGRGGNSVPIAYSYSSKVWQMEMFRTWMQYSSTTTDLNAVYARNSAAGWTSSLQPPRLKYVKSLYDELGFKFTPTFASFMVMPEQPPEFNASQNSGMIYHCFLNTPRHCERGTGPTMPDQNCEYTCESGTRPYGYSEPQNDAVYRYLVNRFNVIMPDGSSAEFRQSDSISVLCDAHNPAPANCLNNSNQITGAAYLATDGSGRRLQISEDQGGGVYKNVLYMPNGGRYVFSSTGIVAMPLEFPAEKFIDVNGNRTEFYYDSSQAEKKVVDTMGRTIKDYLPLNGIAQNQAVETQTFSLDGMNGQPAQNYALKWAQLKASGCEASNVTGCGDSVLENDAQVLSYRGGNSCVGNDMQTYSPSLFQMQAGERVCGRHTSADWIRFNPTVLSEIILPDGTKYKFKYNIYGEITRIDYPTGGYERFRYETIPVLSGESNPTYDQTNRGVVERWVGFDGSAAEQHWTYEATGTTYTAVAPYWVKTTAPDGSRTERHLATASTYEFGFSDALGGMPLEEKTFDTNGDLRSRTLTEWTTKNTTIPHNGGIGVNRDPRVKRKVSIIIEGGKALATLSATDYDESGSSDPTYFSHLNAKKSKSYHYKAITDLNTAKTASLATIAALFGDGDLAAVSETDYSYDSAYRARNIIGLPTETRALNPANQSDVLSKSQIIYDQTAYPIISAGTAAGWQDPNSNLRGSATTSRTWVKETNAWLETHAQFDNFGNLRKAWDARNDPNVFVETEYSSNYYYAYPTKVVTPAPDPYNSGFGTNLTSTAETTYDLTTGLPLSVKNDFGQITKTEYDAYLRPVRVYAHNYAAPETQTIYGAPDSSGQLPAGQRFVKVKKQIDGANWEEATTRFDGLGRTIKTQSKDSAGDVFVETKYDKMGRVLMTTNPYRAGETVLWNLVEYDAAGRVEKTRAPVANQNPNSPSGDILGTTSFDISTVSGYTGTVVVSTDASGRRSRSITNALGQLLRVDEATAAGGTIDADLGAIASPAQATYYTYDAYGKMVKVKQGDQYRYFKYDSLGRLVRVKQPEQETNQSLNLADNYNTSGQWTAGFTYDALGNVLTATDARGVTVTNTYDNLNRVKVRSYAGEASGQQTPPVYYSYDGVYYTPAGGKLQATGNAKGSLTQVRNGISTSQTIAYDDLGRATEYQQITDGETYASKYAYNFAGALETETYPNGRVVKNFFSADGDLSGISTKAGGTTGSNNQFKTRASDFSYTADGKISKLKLGNGLWEAAKFNDRLQITELGLGNGENNPNLWKINYDYGEIESNGTLNASKNTGNIAKQTISFSGLTNPFVQTYRYDSLNRLTEATEKSGATQTWQQTFGYDRFGNRTAFSQQGGTVAIAQPTIDANTNRFNINQGYSYDKNGNVVTDAASGAARTFTFNGENKQTEVKDANGTLIGKYFYDGDGKRVKKQTYDQNGQIKEITVFVYSSGKLIAEYSTASPPQNPTTNYVATDILQSVRAISDANGQITSRRDFMPFGEELASDVNYRTATRKYSSSEDSIRQKFTGYQKDAETTLDFAEARMYENRHGRFTAVDPLLASGKTADPQTFNRYAYVLNNPLKFTDPTGLQTGTKLQPCGKDCGDFVINPGGKSVTAKDRLETVDVTWVDAIVEPIQGVLQTAESLFSRAFERVNSEAQTGQPLESPRLLGNRGLELYFVMDRSFESYEFAANVGLTGINIQSFFVGGFSPSGSTVTTSRGFALTGVSSRSAFSLYAQRDAAIRAEAAVENFLTQNPGANQAVLVGGADLRSTLSFAATNGNVPTNLGTRMQRFADNLGGVGTVTPCGRTVGRCAEFRVANELELRGANPNNIRFTIPRRANRPVPVEICSNCRNMFSIVQFPVGTQ